MLCLVTYEVRIIRSHFLTPYSLYLLGDDGSVANERIFGKTSLSEEMYIGHNMTSTLTLTYNKK